MQIPSTAPLFAWGYLEDSPSLQTLARLLGVILDGPLLPALRERRGRGRNEYPVEALWGVVVLTVALRHNGFEACLAELERNAGMRLLIGIRTAAEVPKSWNLSRFLKTLGEPRFLALSEAAFGVMVERLGLAVPSLGAQTAGDSMGVSARQDRGEAPADLPQPTGGRKEYTDADGRVTKVVEWFGYKLHQQVDVRHEVALAYKVTSAGPPASTPMSGP